MPCTPATPQGSGSGTAHRGRDDEAQAVLDAAAEVAAEALGNALVAVYALGSLAHGGFAPLVSDMDVALVLTEADRTSAERVAAVGPRVRERVPGPLAERLSVFWADLAGVRHGPGPWGRLPAVDRLDLIDSGRLLRGRDVREGAVRPDGPTLVREAAEFAASRFDEAHLASLRDPAGLVADGPRAVTKTVLFPVRLLYTLRTHRIGLNAEAAEYYDGPHVPLVRAAIRWRGEGLDEHVPELLAAHLVGLHVEFLDAYLDVLDGASGPAGRLRAARDRLAGAGA